MRRGLYWTGVVLALGAVVLGGLYAYSGYRATSGPDGAVRGYFAALARGDAPGALAFGRVPKGPHQLLTSEVLAQQLRIAPLDDVRVGAVTEHGNAAEVGYSYRLHFAGHDQDYSGTVRVLDTGSGWQLASTAVATRIRLDQAGDRLAFAGASVPETRTLLFPGALPVEFDTPYLQLDPDTAAVQFGAGRITDVTVQPTRRARILLAAHLRRLLTRCVRSSPPSLLCPQPAVRVVPGSLDGHLVGNSTSQISFQVGSAAAGAVSMTGTVPFVGRYAALTYDNLARWHTGRLALPVDASAYPVGPLAVTMNAGSA